MRVKLKNVGIINDCDVEFIPGINLLIGSSGSGKSTLMRCIYNTATNDFSDSDISFGHNTMSVEIDVDDNIIEYSRSIKSKDDRCYYRVNGETYVKLNRQVLPAVSDTLKIGGVNINGEDVNFNFNLQFSSPFLILGNQSTLYNVLTYRSSFDISSINDFYSADIKSNASEVAVNTKLKENLEDRLKSLELQSNRMSGVEKLYSDYISYKHKSEIIDDLKSINDKLLNLQHIKAKLKSISSNINRIKYSIDNTTSLKELCDYKIKYSLLNENLYKIKLYNVLIHSHENSMSILQSISDIKKLLTMRVSNNITTNNISIISKCIDSSDDLLNNESIIYDLLKQYSFVKSLNICDKSMYIIKEVDSSIINKVSDLILIDNKLSSLYDINLSINKVKQKCTALHNKMTKFNICPLCGSSLNISEYNNE